MKIAVIIIMVVVIFFIETLALCNVSKKSDEFSENLYRRIKNDS
jgi:preprotein translocase subunit SecG